MEYIAAIFAVLFSIVGVIGSIVPVLPGPVIAYVGLMFLHFTGFNITPSDLIVCGILIGVVTIGDYLLAPILTRKAGGSRSATIGSTLGVLISVFIAPVAIVFAAFLGAFIGELIHNPNDRSKAMKVGFYSFVGFICGAFMKIAIVLYMGFLIVKNIIIKIWA